MSCKTEFSAMECAHNSLACCTATSFRYCNQTSVGVGATVQLLTTFMYSVVL